MDFRFDESQQALRSRVAGFLAEVSPSAEVRRLMGTSPGYDPGAWARLAGELGLAGLVVPERFGGSAMGFVELAVVMEEMGASLLCAPFFSTVALATSAILHAGDDAAAAELLPAMAAGELVATVAFAEDDGRWDRAATAARARPGGRGDGWLLQGHKNYVLDGDVAGLIVVAAIAASGVSLFLVDGDAPGLERTPLRTVDQTRRQARLVFEDTPARLLGADGQGGAVLSRVLDLAAVALAAEQVGGARRCLEMAVEYAGTRIQFGRPIGSFQAVKHKCAQMLVELETARSAAYYAAWAATRMTPELAVAASMAKARCSDAYARVAADNIQIHGGIGFTWDNDAHLHYRRSRSSAQLLGDARHHRERLARGIGL